MSLQFETTDRPPLLIVGASTRAAAFSAIRAGLQPCSVDLYADLDLCRVCPVQRISPAQFPQGLPEAARDEGPAPWMYVGAIENYPNVVAAIARERQLWGNGADVLRRVRDPYEVSQCLTNAGLAHPAVRSQPSELSTAKRWLVKPIDGAGGRGIRPFAGDWTNASDRYYFQEQIDGVPCAAAYIGFDQAAIFIGLTRQLVGESDFHARPFHYCGSIGPLSLDCELVEQLEQLGRSLATGFRLLGLFGVDGILADRQFWPVEINPRYTASLEILEYAIGVPLLKYHRDACTGGMDDPCRVAIHARREMPTKTLGKAVLFAGTPTCVPDSSADFAVDHAALAGWQMPRVADIPRAGERIESGPICTVFAGGASEVSVESALRDRAKRVYASLAHAVTR